MLRTTPGLSRPVFRWVSQVTASLGATMAATLIWSVVPHPGAAPAPQTEFTSGGKFAARAVEAVAYDGLDAMPAPRLAGPPAPSPALPMLAAAPSGLLRRASWEEGSATAVPDRPARGTRPAPRAPLRAEARPAHGEVPRRADDAAAAAPDRKAGEGFFSRLIPGISSAITGTARDAWTVTASAGEALVGRVMPSGE